MSTIRVNCKNLKGELRVPVSKSILHRYLVCSYLDDDYDAIRGIEEVVGQLSDDVKATRDCLLQIVDAEPGKKLSLNCGESGTTLRFMVPLVAALGIEADIIAEGSLVNRPMKEFTDELGRHGATIGEEILADENAKVYHISGKLEEGDYMLPGNISSQFISGVMLASELVDGDVWVCIEGELESASYVDMTEQVITAFDMGRGAKMLESDWSNGAMWVVANDLLEGRLKVKGLAADSIQGDAKIIDILNDYAIRESLEDVYGDAVKRSNIKFDVSDCPDLAPAIAVRALKSSLVTVIDDAGRLTKKECNRLDAIVEILSQLGADIKIGSNNESIVIVGNGGNLLPGSDEPVNTYGDHRMVMMAAMASIMCEKPVVIDGHEAISKSYPTFFEQIEELGGIE